MDRVAQIKQLVKDHLTQNEASPFIPGITRIPLAVPSFGYEETWEAIESLLTAELTMGKKVHRFERLFAEYVGVRHAIMVNSGSSANLLALSILTNHSLERPLKPGDEVITPAVTWATTVFPIINCGLVPVLVDVDLDTLDINPEEIEKAISDKTRAIMPVHLLGNPCAMDTIMNIAKRHHLLVIEDACEAHGATWQGQKTGSFGDLATFSFFFSHHITTIEGGMVLTDNDELAELARALRVFGWVRDLKDKEEIAQKYPDMDPRYLFVTLGYNFRPTEIQGAFGLHQIKKLDQFIQIRRENAAFWTKNLGKYSDYLQLHEERSQTQHVRLGYSVTVRHNAPFTRKDLVDFLENKGVETRPIMAGNIEEQPAMRMLPYRKVGELPNARLVHRNSFFFGNHIGIGAEEREAMVSYFDEFMASWRE